MIIFTIGKKSNW